MPPRYARTRAAARAMQRPAVGAPQEVTPEGRAALAQAAADVAGDRHVAGFARLYPDLAKWLGTSTTDFATSLKARIRGGQLLTDNQLAALRRAAAPLAECNVDAIEAVFATARANGVKYPKLRLGRFRLAPAGERSAHSGAIFVTTPKGTETYARIAGGRLFRYFACTDEIHAEILAAIANPAESALAYGRRTGECAVCGRSLEATDSVDAGIGPICAGRYFGGFEAYKELKA